MPKTYQIAFEKIPDEIVEDLIPYFDVGTLKSILPVSKGFFVRFYPLTQNIKIWKAAYQGLNHRGTETEKQLQMALVKAVKADEVDTVYRITSLGVNTNFILDDSPDMEFEFGDPAAGHFLKPTFMSWAANHAYGENGAIITCLVIMNGADVSTESSYRKWVGDPHGGPPLEFGTDEHPMKETPAESAPDSTVRTIILLTEFENEIKSHNNSQRAIDLLMKAKQTNRSFADAYFNELTTEQKEHQGLQAKLTANQVRGIRRDPRLRAEPGIDFEDFAKKHWMKITLLGFGFDYVLISGSATKVGIILLSIFSSVTLPAFFTTIIGVLILGLIAKVIIKKIEDFFSSKPASYPVTYEIPKDFQAKSSYASILFKKLSFEKFSHPSSVSVPALDHPKASDNNNLPILPLDSAPTTQPRMLRLR